MPPVARRLKVFASPAGLHIRAIRRDGLSSHGWRFNWLVADEQRPVQVQSETNGAAHLEQLGKALSVYGIIGILEAFGAAYLLLITTAEVVANLKGKDLFKITGVAAIPLVADDAVLALTGLANLYTNRDTFDGNAEPVAFLAGAFDADEPEDDDQPPLYSGAPTESFIKAGESAPQPQSRRASSNASRSIAEEVYQALGSKGKQLANTSGQRKLAPWDNARHVRSHERLSSRSPSSTPARNSLDEDYRETSSTTKEYSAEQPRTTSGMASEANQSRRDEMALNTLPKIVQAARNLFSAGIFFFSYEYDITRRLATQHSRKSNHASLWRSADPEYFWNKHLLKLLIDSGHDSLILPIMQGFVGQSSFSVPQNLQASTEDMPCNLSVISRRSVLRNGLRYLRRGLDDRGAVANSVETEQILSTLSTLSEERLDSFVQVRGSIPLFFTQNPFNLKPVPVMTRGEKVNKEAFSKHFETLNERYGKIHAISLVNKKGNEAAIGQRYHDYASSLSRKWLEEHPGNDSKRLTFDWTDFHALCHGMHFEKVSSIVDASGAFLNSSAWTITAHGVPLKLQGGCVRTNCMDCLDRTNVVQAAIAQYVLELQLSTIASGDLEAAHPIDLRSATSMSWFDVLWADHGDAVSTAYTSTSALKGDYVRTRTRNWYGVINDARLSITRYYYNLFGDHFLQGVIDFCLGYTSEDVFEELEKGIMTVLTANREADEDVQKEQQVLFHVADEIMQGHVDELGFVTGWVLFDIHEDKKPSKVLFLLDDATMYKVHYDWDNGEIQDMRSVPAKFLHSVQWGTLLTDISTSAQRDEARNVGLKVLFALEDGLSDSWTFKQPAIPSSRGDQPSEKMVMQQISEELARWLLRAEAAGLRSQPARVEEKAIVDLAEAKRKVGWANWAAAAVQKGIWN